MLWRPRPTSAESVEIRQLRGGGAGKTEWAEGEATAAWPEELALDDGAAYVLQKGETDVPEDLKEELNNSMIGTKEG